MADQNTMNQGPAIPTADEYLGRGKEVCADAVRRIRGFQNDAERYIRENPARAVLTALAVGFALGLLIRR